MVCHVEAYRSIPQRSPRHRDTQFGSLALPILGRSVILHPLLSKLLSVGPDILFAYSTLHYTAMNWAATSAIDTMLDDYSADPDALRRFDEVGPELLPYATLLNGRMAGDDDLHALIGVYEWQNEPLIFLVDHEQLRDDLHFQRLRRRLAMRGDAQYIGVIRPGRMVVHDVSLDGRSPADTIVPLQIEPSITLPFLANERPGGDSSRRRWISEVVLKLLDQSISELLKSPVISGDDAISLVGRALFTRFLGDRKLLTRSSLVGASTEIDLLFDNPDSAEATSSWLDNTFNGDFLPLRAGLFRELPPTAFSTLGNILRRAPDGQLYFSWKEDWAHLNFAHIPVGVLSQAYELYLRKHSPGKQRKEGGYYTPATIAQIMVRGAFHALQREGSAHTTRVLDPAAGAGVFLLSVFRHLVSERWRHDDARPDTRTLREILYTQITGFDINESALRFAALGLYLLSIELDPDPEPVEKLRFEDLRGSSVLQKVGDDGSLGSLSAEVGTSHAGRYDLVIGNPPWASSTGLSEWSLLKADVQKIAEERLPNDRVSRLFPNEVLDLPFIWRAMQWCRPGGQIAFALHGRLLFQQHEGMAEARNAIFRALDVTGVVNGAELRNTNVWPEISAPFCLLFARNRCSPPGGAFKFVSPHLEDRLNWSGGLRIDAANAEVVATEQLVSRPEVLKILFRGGRLDLEVFERVSSRPIGTLRTYWQGYFGGSGRRLNCAGNGYQSLRRSSPRSGDGEVGFSATDLHGLKELTHESMQSILVDRDELASFTPERVHRIRSKSLYTGPLLLVHKSPPATAGRIRASVTDEDLVFSETYYGYSAHLHPRGRQLVRYLALLIGSRPAFWHCFMTSGEFGFERDVFEKATIDSIPVPSFDTLEPDALKQIDVLFDAVASNDSEEAWAEVDKWAAGLYGLREYDLQVIEDTLRFNLPFAANRRAAQLQPDSRQIQAFCASLNAELNPWALKRGNSVEVVPHPLPIGAPWQVVRVQIRRSADQIPGIPSAWTEVLRVADQLAATEVVYSDTSAHCLWIARLSQARYWSISSARAVAREIVWNHVDVLLGAFKS